MKRLIIITGAGLSAESGIPTFRTAGGLWENFNIEDVCNINTFLKNYIMVNDFYDTRRVSLNSVQPNAAHLAIADLCTMYEVVNITTNVDDLLERAGCTSVMHLHGELCSVITNHGTSESKVIQLGYTKSPYDDPALYPVKPNVIFFGEHAPMYRDLYDIVSNVTSEDLVVIVGSSEQVLDFTEMVAYADLYNPPKILFVNPDPKLCSRKTLLKAVPFQCTAVDFFTNHINVIHDIMNQPAVTSPEA